MLSVLHVGKSPPSELYAITRTGLFWTCGRGARGSLPIHFQICKSVPRYVFWFARRLAVAWRVDGLRGSWAGITHKTVVERKEKTMEEEVFKVNATILYG